MATYHGMLTLSPESSLDGDTTEEIERLEVGGLQS